MNANYPVPFLVGKTYYFRYTDRLGIRKKASTGHQKKIDAQRYVISFIDRMRSGMDSKATLRSMIQLFQDPETNPKKNQATVTAAYYSDRYALHTATHAKDLEKLLGAKMRTLLDKPVYDVIRLEIKQAAVVIAKEYGQCNKSNKLYKLLKSMFAQAADDGLIPVNTAQGLPDIKFQKTTRMALPAADIKLVLSHPEIFPSDEARRFFTILATTGLRRAELLAMGPDQVRGDILVVDRAYKDDSMKVIGAPKWGKSRVIPLCNLASLALKEALKNGIDAEPIRVSTKKLSTWFKQIREHVVKLQLQRPEAWAELTPHVLRHSLNTNLLLTGISAILVAEYMSWEHQGVNAVQEGYTELYAENLRIIADRIDVMYGLKENILSFEVAQ